MATLQLQTFINSPNGVAMVTMLVRWLLVSLSCTLYKPCSFTLCSSLKPCHHIVDYNASDTNNAALQHCYNLNQLSNCYKHKLNVASRSSNRLCTQQNSSRPLPVAVSEYFQAWLTIQSCFIASSHQSALTIIGHTAQWKRLQPNRTSHVCKLTNTIERATEISIYRAKMKNITY